MVCLGIKILVSKTFTFVLKLNKMNFYSTFENSQIEYLFYKTKVGVLLLFCCFLGATSLPFAFWDKLMGGKILMSLVAGVY